jgi:dephospho-CoA kinase
VVRRLAARGFHVLDLDDIAREVMAPGGAAHDDVVAEFGSAVLTRTGAIDRKALAAVVFQDSEARARLNAIVHPRVRQEERRRALVWADEPRGVVVTEAALLVEAGMHLRFDRLVVVSCNREQQSERLMARDGIDFAAARARIDSQMPLAAKRWFAHLEVETSGPLEDTDRAADALAGHLLTLAGSLPQRRPIPLARALGCVVHGPAVGPRELDPVRLLRAIAAAGGLELEALGRELTPPARGPWYQEARGGHAAPGPETLMGPLVLWASTRGRIDPEFLAGAAATLARLTHLDPGAIGAACFRARLLDELSRGTRVDQLEPALPSWRDELSRWGPVPTVAQTAPVLAALRQFPGDPVAAREACRRAGGDPDFAGAAVGLASAALVTDPPAGLVAALESLGP